MWRGLVYLQFTEAERGIGASKAETVRERDVDLVLLSSIRNIIAIKFRSRFSSLNEVECWREDVLQVISLCTAAAPYLTHMMYPQHREDCFHTTSSAEQMPHCTFCAADVDLKG